MFSIISDILLLYLVFSLCPFSLFCSSRFFNYNIIIIIIIFIVIHIVTRILFRGSLTQPPGSAMGEEKDYQDMICLGRKGGQSLKGEGL